jgi:signal transduction histidine kinase
MDRKEQTNVEDMALAAELARHICHEFNNFLYNLLLQIEIGARSKPDSLQDNWIAIKNDAAHVTRLMQEWNQFHNRFVYEESKIDLHEIIRQMAREASVQDQAIELSPAILNSSMFIVSSVLDCRHLLRLLVEDLANECRNAADKGSAISIDTETAQKRSRVRIAACELEPANGTGKNPSLLAGACKALAVRLGAAIHHELVDGRKLVLVDFPSIQ